MEYRKTYTEYWAKQHKSINYRVANNFFPKINRWFRPKSNLEIDTLRVAKNDLELLKNLDIDKLELENDKCLIQVPADKIIVMGNFYQKINSPRPTNLNTPIYTKVTERVNKYREGLALRRFNKQTFTQNNPSHDPKKQNRIMGTYFTNLTQVQKIIKTLPNKCSSGLDGIPQIVIKHLPLVQLRNLTAIFNNCLNNKYFPEAWKCAKILPILKPNKDPHDPSSHRPISLTSNTSKILEIVISNSIELHCKKHKIIPDTQFGFQRKLTTNHAINATLEIINEHLHKNELVGACLVDIEKAFDSTLIDGLIFILILLKFPLYLIDVIYDMITNKKFRIWDGKNITELVFLILAGLMRGTVNSPKLFNILTKGVLLLFIHEVLFKKYAIAYADDLLLMIAPKYPKIILEE